MKVIAIFDDTGKKSEVISDIIGEKGFADVVIKKRRIEDCYRESLSKVYPDIHFRMVHSFFEFADIIKELDVYQGSNVKVIHCFSNYYVVDEDKAGLSLKKLFYVENDITAMDGNRAVLGMFPNLNSYISFLKRIMQGQKAWDILRATSEHFSIDGMIDIGVIGNFIQCITGDFESRFFNSVAGNEYTITKSSTNKKKIEAEYKFYHLLPEDMKYWFVMPFNYKETENDASYTMEHLHMTDLAIKWVHGSMGEVEFRELMDKYFYFFKCRHEKGCSEKDVESSLDRLYVEKVRARTDRLKGLDEYGKVEKLLEACDVCLDELISKYFCIYEKTKEWRKKECRLVIGHGDPCFANALYNKSAQILKFIDPKGALTEDELWMDEYYDVAKLSHSVCGRYDFFNSGLYDIRIDGDLNAELDIPFDNTMYKDIFREKCVENGFDYRSVRVYEASLFLSMLPLHIDYPHKVLGFILNVKDILKEIESYV